MIGSRGPIAMATFAFSPLEVALPSVQAGVGREPLILAARAWPTRCVGFFWPARGETMPKYVIERDIPGAGKLSPGELQGISQKSCGVLTRLGPQIQWVTSYVTGDKIYCVYIAPNEEMVREHARQGGFPANRVSEVKSVIDPTTAEV
jgi:hypothetical protein